MIGSQETKEIVKSLGADLCGIAPIDRFSRAPEGFHPRDIYEDGKSVVVFAKKLPIQPLFASNCVPYTHVSNLLTQEVDRLGIEVSFELEKQGIGVVLIPSDDPYEYWEPERCHGRAILSLRHAGHLAGLGVLGKNTLLMNKNFGNMIQLGAVLIDLKLEGDPIATYEVCPSDCRICIESCPQGALDGMTVNQQLCRPLSNYRTEKGYVLKKCSLCRSVCPSCFGMEIVSE